MVARFVSGKSIWGAISYNEEKAEKGTAIPIYAERYAKNIEHLSFPEKFNRLKNLAALNLITQTNCVHISLNFDPSEKFDAETFSKIAQSYMQKIGFGQQPFLVYQHLDAGHPHIHIVSTNILSNGDRIPLHNIGRYQSEQARKEIELEFGLVKAQAKQSVSQKQLEPVILEKAVYGKSETKKAISHIVQQIVRTYKFTSLAELNAALMKYNIVADRGIEGTRMYENAGLVYQVTDDAGQKMGVPIKSSSLPSKPTLKKLALLFEKNKIDRKPYRELLKNLISKVANSPDVRDINQFTAAMDNAGVITVLRKNTEGRIYGITFVDHRSRTVFNGSDISKEFTANRLLAMLTPEKPVSVSEKSRNEDFVKEVLSKVNFGKGVKSSLLELYRRGLRILVENENGKIKFLLGHRDSLSENYVPASSPISAYLRVNGITEDVVAGLNNAVKEAKVDNSKDQIFDLQASYWDGNHSFSEPEFVLVLAALLAPANEGPDPYDRRKKKKKRINPSNQQ